MTNLKDKPWYRLNIITENAIRNDFDFNEKFLLNRDFDLWRFGYFDGSTAHQSIFNKDWIEYFESLGFIITQGELFRRLPNTVNRDRAHVDIISNESPKKICFALNWIINDVIDEGEMIWYEVPPMDQMKYDQVKMEDEVGQTYGYWPKELYIDKEIDRVIIGKQATLVRTDLLHNVEASKSVRACISLRSFVPGLNSFSTWDEAIDKLKNLIIE